MQITSSLTIIFIVKLFDWIQPWNFVNPVHINLFR